MSRYRCALGCMALFAGSAMDAHDPPHPDVPPAACRMTIAMIDEAEVGAAQLRIAINQVDRIWRAEGVAFAWTDETRPGEEALTIVVQRRVLWKDRRLVGGSRDVLGFVPVSDGQLTRVITVSLGSVRSLLANAMVRGRPLSQRPQRLRLELEAQALGRVMAHEIGHYRLRLHGHTATGLMRPVFTTQDLLDADISRFYIDRELFRAALGARADVNERVDCRRDATIVGGR